MDNDRTEHEKDAPLLFTLKKRNVYAVPDGFFQDLEKAIHTKYPSGNRRILRRMKRWAKVSVVVLLLSIIFFSGAKIIFYKNYLPVETDRTIYNVLDGDRDGISPE